MFCIQQIYCPHSIKVSKCFISIFVFIAVPDSTVCLKFLSSYDFLAQFFHLLISSVFHGPILCQPLQEVSEIPTETIVPCVRMFVVYLWEDRQIYLTEKEYVTDKQSW